MRLATYISDLLYRYECVIVPEFGGFVTNEVSARVNNFTHSFYPPTKQLSFNSHLKNNDGLLANYIASVEKISFSEAVSLIKEEISTWNQLLKNETIELEKIGSISKNNEGILIFEPALSENYLISSFGLNSFNSPAIKREEYLKKVRSLKTTAPIVPVIERRKTPVFLKYAASAAILFAIGSVIWDTYNENQYQQQLFAEHQQQEIVNKKIQEATFVIDNPLPTITLNVSKEIKNYHIIAGAFRETPNADKKVQQLIGKGYDAQILGVNKWGLTQVAFASFNSRIKAINSLNTIKKEESSDAWLLVQEF